MEFLAWHYSSGIEYYLESIPRTLNWIINYFSPMLLLKTLFAPWKRLILVDTSAGFDFRKKFEVFTFNLISRSIGATVRFILFWVGIFLIVLTFLGSVIGFVFWLALPLFSYPVYLKYRRQPENYVSDLLYNIKAKKQNPLEVIFNSEAGQFVASHTGLTPDYFIQNAKVKEVDLEEFKPKNFTDIIEYLIKSNVWNKEVFSKADIESNDLILSSLWWDRKQLEENETGTKEYGRPGIALELTFGYTPNLNRYSADLSIPLPYSHRLIGRAKIVERMERILASGVSVMLTGAPGVGKKTVVLEFAKKAKSGALGREMAFKRVLEFDYNTFLSEATDLNQKKTELALILAEAAGAGNIILMIRDIQRLINPEVEGYDFTDVFEKHLERRVLKIIAVSTNNDYERFIAPNLRIRKYLERVEVDPPSKEEALEIILDAARRWENLTGLTIEVPALRHIIEESDRYITEVPFPEKALEFLDEVVSFVQQHNISKITVQEANLVLSERTGISFAKLTPEEKRKLEVIEDIIHQRLINQGSAISLIGKTLRAKTIGVVKEKRPLGSFLFLGPTGVGKTETAKVLARVYYGSEENMIRFDMQEYSGEEGLERLIGSVRKNLPGALTTAIKNKPASLVLLDEIEKASKEIYNLFLSLLDEGIITDAFGRKIICRNLFIIGTSNAGAEYVRQLVGKGIKGEELQREVINYCLEKEIFSPEFLNRFDGVVVYEPLRKEDLVKIANLMLMELAENLRMKNVYLSFGEDVIKKLAYDGFDPSFGARPMRRIVNLTLGDLISRAILRGEIKQGDKVQLVAGESKNEFKLEKTLE